MIFVKLDTLELVNEVCRVCEKYKNKMDIDIKHGRYTVDGCSILGVTSLLGNIVKVIPVTDDDLLISYFQKDMESIGGYTV